MNGAFSILLGGLFCSKESHDAIAHIFIHHTSIEDDAACENLHDFVHLFVDGLSVEEIGDAAEAFYIGKQHGNFAQFTFAKLQFLNALLFLCIQRKEIRTKDKVIIYHTVPSNLSLGQMSSLNCVSVPKEVIHDSAKEQN